jgi:hypothetical protein
MDFNELITHQYDSANAFADAAVVLIYPLVILHWSDGAAQRFGYTATEAVGKDLSLLFPKVGVITDLVESEYAHHLDARSRSVETKGKRVGHGALIDVLTRTGKTVKARCSIYPLTGDEKLYLLLFFAVEDNKTEAYVEKITSPNSPFSPGESNPFIFGPKWVLHIWQTQPVLFFLLAFLGITGLGIWRVESIGKLYKEIKPPTEKVEKSKELPLPPGCKRVNENSIICE